MAARIASHGRRATHSSIEPNGRPSAIPSCASHRGALSGTLRSSTTQRPPRGERRGAVGDDVSAFRHVRQGVGGQDRVDLGRELELGRVGLHEADVAPAVALDPMLGLGEHRVGQIDADDPAVGADRLLDQREVQTGAAGDVDDGVARAKPECLTARRRWVRWG